MYSLISLAQHPDICSKHHKSLVELFFANSSKKNFQNRHDKDAFYEKWLAPYLVNWPHHCFQAFTNKKQFVGYLTGCPCSESADSLLGSKVSSYRVFAHKFKEFPAHFHINVNIAFQGQGVGKILVNNFENTLIENHISGVHIVTSSDQDNVNFYHRLNYEIIDEKKHSGLDLLFMGKKLFK